MNKKYLFLAAIIALNTPHYTTPQPGNGFVGAFIFGILLGCAGGHAYGSAQDKNADLNAITAVTSLRPDEQMSVLLQVLANATLNGQSSIKNLAHHCAVQGLDIENLCTKSSNFTQSSLSSKKALEARLNYWDTHNGDENNKKHARELLQDPNLAKRLTSYQVLSNTLSTEKKYFTWYIKYHNIANTGYRAAGQYSDIIIANERIKDRNILIDAKKELSNLVPYTTEQKTYRELIEDINVRIENLAQAIDRTTRQPGYALREENMKLEERASRNDALVQQVRDAQNEATSSKNSLKAAQWKNNTLEGKIETLEREVTRLTNELLNKNDCAEQLRKTQQELHTAKEELKKEKKEKDDALKKIANAKENIKKANSAYNPGYLEAALKENELGAYYFTKIKELENDLA